MVADSKRDGNYHLGSATLLAFRYVVWSGVRYSLMHFGWCICTGNLNSYLSFLSVLISAAKVGIIVFFSYLPCTQGILSYLPLTSTSSRTTYTGSCFHLTCFSYFIFFILFLICLYFAHPCVDRGFICSSLLSWSFYWVSEWRLLLCVARSLLGLYI